MTKNKKVCVIGSGFGGLSAAIRLQAAGFDVTILEKRDLPGGRAYVYRDSGFIFDAGPTVITAPDCIRELFEICQEEMSKFVELIPVSPFYRLFWNDGYKFDYGSDLNATIEQIKHKSPNDVQGYLQFLDYSQKVYNKGYVGLAHKPFLNFWSMIKVAPDLVTLSAHKSVYETVSKFISDPHLREAFSFHSLLVGGNPFKTSSIYTLIHYLERSGGVFFPRGGTGALVAALVKLFKSKNGKLILNAEVEEILTERKSVKSVRLTSGEVFECDVLVSNADVVHTYSQLIQNEKTVNRTRKRAANMSQGMSLFLIYFGTKKTYPNMAHHNVIFGPRYEGLLDDIFTHGKLSDDFSLYLHVPSRTDPQLAPPGHEAFYVLSPVPHLGKANIDWNSEAPRYADKILSYLEQKFLPNLKENIVSQRVFTPLDFKTQLNSHLGSAFSFEPTLKQSAYFRTRNKDPFVRGLYFVGAGTHPGAGVPGVINSAKATANLIYEDFGI